MAAMRVTKEINSVTTIQKTGPRAAHTGEAIVDQGFREAARIYSPEEAGPPFSFCSLEGTGRQESANPPHSQPRHPGFLAFGGALF